MYDIRQFKPVLYFLVFLGMCGFALAAESSTAFILSTIALAINAWLMRRGWFKPMPRLLSNLVTICAAIYVFHEVLTSGNTPVLMIGEFLMLLQIVKLWEQRGNRDYGQLLVLSLLLMVAAAISTASIIFGLMLVIYLFLSLYCCLLFHLKVETDAAREAMKTPSQAVAPAALRQDQRYLTHSMRKLTGVIATVAIFFAVIVFLFFPRGTGAGMLGPVEFRPTQALVGFNDEVSFQNIARIQQNETVVATVHLSHNGQPVRSGTLLLRGVTVDSYMGRAGTWRWVRWSRDSDAFPGDGGMRRFGRMERPEPDDDPSLLSQKEVSAGETRTLGNSPVEPPDKWQQDIQLLPTGTNVLFAMAGAYSISPLMPTHTMEYRYSMRDGEMRNITARERERAPSETRYRVVSSNNLGDFPPPRGSGTLSSNIDPKIRAFALRPEVSGADANGPLAAQRAKHILDESEADDLDGRIAANIEKYLKTNFSYTLDLTDTRQIEGQDPLVTFLYDNRKGHCEYFAGAMTLLCQSLGLKARMCLGFRCDEYNGTPGADYYIVRQSHAHAWVEVFTKSGWKTFDPTSESDAVEQARHAGTWQKIRHVFDYLQYAYGESIITYSNEDRTNLIQNTESMMLQMSSRPTSRYDYGRRFQLDQLFASKKFLAIFSAVLLAAMALMGAAVLFLIIRYALEQWRLRRRAERIGIGSLPDVEQLRLARQLEFYDDLLSLLTRHRMTRRPQQTPLEFSRSLLFLPAKTYEAIRRLTELFYRVRYGNVELSPAMQKHLERTIQKLARDLG